MDEAAAATGHRPPVTGHRPMYRYSALLDWRMRGNSLVGRAQPSKAEAQFRNLFPAP